MNTNTIIAIIAALVIGLLGGYALARTSQNLTMTHTMSMVMDGMTGDLENRRGADFEQAFLDEMILHHEGAVQMARMALQRSNREELVKLANEIIQAQNKEIELMRGWKAQWFGGAAESR